MQSALCLPLTHLVCKCLALCHQLQGLSGGNERLCVRVSLFVCAYVWGNKDMAALMLTQSY